MSSIDDLNEFTQKMNFDAILSELKEKGKNTSEQGTLFEIFCKKILVTSPMFVDDVIKVWIWKEFPGNGGLHDNGIDLVVLDKNNEFWAIQCKFYGKDEDISKRDIDSFVSASTRQFIYENKTYSFSRKYIFSTTDGVSHNASGLNYSLYGPEKLLKCGIDWEHFKLDEVDNMQALVKKTPKPHQEEAINNVINGFKNNDRGRLIMACGTGKTFTSLKIVEKYINTLHEEKVNILYLVPSIPLLSQTILEWKTQTIIERCNMFGICSDETAGQDRRARLRDEITATMPIPATTDSKRINVVLNKSRVKVNFFFSTYQSIDVVKQIQDDCGITFSMTICDEAHRTIGAYKEDEEDKSDFIKVHDSNYIHSNKRLYMTATEKIYSSGAIANAEEGGWKVYSMDDEKTYGPEFHYLSFGEAVSKQLLTDYRLLVLNIRKSDIANLRLPNNLIADLDDASKIIGALTALSKIPPEGNKEEFVQDPKPMKRVVAFCASIAHADSVAESFNKLINSSCLGEEYMMDQGFITPKAKLITGRDNTKEKNKKLNWLRDKIENGECRILTNARCLSEGVDVPSLDSIVFMARRRSQVDIIQAVGRVMRKFGSGVEKKYGYIIIPVVINDEKLTDKTLSSNEDYKVVWQVVQALRSHDERLDTEINKVGVTGKLPANICVLDTFIPPISRRGYKVGSYRNEREEGLDSDNPNDRTSNITVRIPTDEELKENEKVFSAQLVKHCGNRLYWDDWSTKIGEVTNNVALKIKSQISDSPHLNKSFQKFVKDLQKILNPNISDEDCISMISQHIVTLPVLKSIFNDNELIDKNPITIIMESMVKRLTDFSSELVSLESFYDSVKKTVEGVTNSEGRQEIIRKLFEKFFRYVDPKTSDKNGVVYTPIEIVDFIIQSINYCSKKYFNSDIFTKDVKILDPFTGTGTFIVRLLETINNLNKNTEDFKYKYNHDIWCNEIMLMSYYIALINIEDTYAKLTGEFQPFTHSLLTDTFQLAEKFYDKNSEQVTFEFNEVKVESEKANAENSEKFRIILGNPPYSAGQKKTMENNRNNSYPLLEERTKSSYGKNVDQNNIKEIHDSYIKAFRYSSDRIGEKGIISYISNGSYIDGKSLRGFRREIIKDFNHVYIINLRGKSGKYSGNNNQEGENVFGNKSQCQIAIVFLIKTGEKTFDNYINYFDIGMALSSEEKLNKLKDLKSIQSITFEQIYPDENNDWLNQVTKMQNDYIELANEKNKANKDSQSSIFSCNYSSGIKTGKDIWSLNFDTNTLHNNVSKFYENYNNEVKKLKNDPVFLYKLNKKEKIPYLRTIISNDKEKIQWNDELIQELISPKEKTLNFKTTECLCFPLVKKHLFWDYSFYQRKYKYENIFPYDLKNNICIIVPTSGNFSVFASNTIVKLGCLEACQVFPLYWFDEKDENNLQLNFASYTEQDNYAITNYSLSKFRQKYNDDSITKEDIFYYLYGVFNSKKYVELYKNMLLKDFPRIQIPFLDNFKGFSKTGKELLHLHINYEKLPPYNNLEIKNNKNYSFTSLRYLEKEQTLLFNDSIVIKKIPREVNDYKIGSKSPLQWIVSQYRINRDFDTNIENNPNLYSKDLQGEYVYNLVLSAITLSLESQKLINNLPEYKELK